MVNILYLADNFNQAIDFLNKLNIELADNDCFHIYDRLPLTMQTKYATLYVKSINDTLFGILPKINYYVYEIDFAKFTEEQTAKIQGLINNSISIKYAKDAEKINADEILEILMGGKHEH